MNEDAKRMKAAYARDWRRKNPDRARLIQDRYWEKKAEMMNKSDLKKED